MGVGFPVSVINEVEMATMLILYKTVGKKCKRKGDGEGLRGRNQDYYTFI